MGEHVGEHEENMHVGEHVWNMWGEHVGEHVGNMWTNLLSRASPRFSPTFMNTSSIVVMETPKLATPRTALRSTHDVHHHTP